MQDFYYILGVQPTSSTQEIKEAYKKLAPKFHPDKNNSDPFFTERFKEIQQAYETLSNPIKRRQHDAERTSFNSTRKSNSSNIFLPEIEYFRVSSPTFEYDVEITFSWKTLNADQVTIKPFGKVQPTGQKTVKFKDFKTPALTLELSAENTLIQGNIKCNLTIKNKTYQDSIKSHKKETDDKNKSTSQINDSTISGNRKIQSVDPFNDPIVKTILWLTVILFICILLALAA